MHSMLRLDTTPKKRWMGFDLKFKIFSFSNSYKLPSQSAVSLEDFNVHDVTYIVHLHIIYSIFHQI